MHTSQLISVSPTQAVGAAGASRFETYLFRAYLALLVWVPLPYASVNTWAWAIMDVWIFGLALAWLWGYLKGRQQITPAFRKAAPILLIWLVWLAYISLQCLPLPFSWVAYLSPQAAALHAFSNPAYTTLSVDPHSSADGLLLGVGYVLLFGLTLLLADSGVRLRWISYALVFSGLFQAVFGFFMVLTGLEYGFFIKKPSYLGFATGTFISRNHLAGYLEMCIPIGIGALIAQFSGDGRQRSWRQHTVIFLEWMLSPKLRLRAFLMLMVIGLVMTRSRMGNTAFFASMLISGVLTLLVSRQANRSTVILLMSLILIDICVVSTWFGLDQLAQRIETTDMAGEQSRLIPDQQSLSYWRDYKLTGSGLRSYYVTYYRYEGSASSIYQGHPHNDYVQFAYETGIIGISLLAAAVLSSYYVALSALRYRHRSWNRGLSFAVVMAITAILIHSDSDFNLQIPANALSFMLVLGLAWVARYMPTNNGKQTETMEPIANYKTLALGAMAILVCLAWVAVGRGTADLLAKHAEGRIKDTAMISQPEQTLNDAESALSLATLLDPANPLLSQHMAEVNAWRTALAPTLAEKRRFAQIQLRHQLDSARLCPASPLVWADIAITKDTLMEYDSEFQSALEKASRLAPWDESTQHRIVRMGLASWYRLPDPSHDLIIDIIQLAVTHKSTRVTDLITKTNRQWLICAYTNSRRGLEIRNGLNKCLSQFRML